MGDKNWLSPGSLSSENLGSKNCILLDYCACVVDARIAYLKALHDEVCSVTKRRRKHIQVTQIVHVQLTVERRLDRPHFTIDNQRVEAKEVTLSPLVMQPLAGWCQVRKTNTIE